MYLSIYLPIYLSIYLPTYLSIYLSVNPQDWKRSYSTRPPQCSKLTTSKTKQACETPTIFQLDSVKNEAILRGFLIFRSWQHQKQSNSARLQKWKVECRADGLVPMRIAIFSVHVSKVLGLPRKSEARSHEVLHLSHNIILPNLTIWCPKMQNSGNQRPDLLTSLMNMSLVLRLPHKMHLCRSSSKVPRVPARLKLPQNAHVLLIVGKVQNPVRLPRKATSERPKVLQAPQFFTLLTWQRASRHHGVHFFDIWTSKSAPRMVSFVHFGLEMCFAPQRRALFRHLNVLRATTACTFSTSQFPKVVRTRQFLTLLTLKCASHHNGVHFFCSFSSLTLPTSAFPSAHIVGSLTSKLPSILHDLCIYIYIHILIVYTCIYIYIHTYWLYIHAYCIYIYIWCREESYTSGISNPYNLICLTAQLPTPTLNTPHSHT